MLTRLLAAFGLRRPPEPPATLLCLSCGAETPLFRPEDCPMACPGCGAEFGPRRAYEDMLGDQPMGIIKTERAWSPEEISMLRQRWDEAMRARDAGLQVAFYAGEECS